MGSIRVKVCDLTGQKEYWAQVPDDVPSRRIVARLVTMMRLPITGPSEEILSYKLHHKRLGKQIGDNETLTEANVLEGDLLRLTLEMTAGGDYAQPADYWVRTRHILTESIVIPKKHLFTLAASFGTFIFMLRELIQLILAGVSIFPPFFILMLLSGSIGMGGTSLLLLQDLKR